jgi:hypothetical protein
MNVFLIGLIFRFPDLTSIFLIFIKPLNSDQLFSDVRFSSIAIGTISYLCLPMRFVTLRFDSDLFDLIAPQNSDRMKQVFVSAFRTLASDSIFKVRKCEMERRAGSL